VLDINISFNCFQFQEVISVFDEVLQRLKERCRLQQGSDVRCFCLLKYLISNGFQCSKVVFLEYSYVELHEN
jgi:hypothetical protein